jgi:hypothetical protein
MSNRSINKTKLAVIAAIAAVSFASPALAQAWDARAGGANVLQFRYGPGGTRQFSPGVDTSQLAVPQIGQGLYNYVAPQAKQPTNHRR